MDQDRATDWDTIVKPSGHSELDRSAREAPLREEDVFETFVERWLDGDEITAESWLAGHPAIEPDGEDAFELIYTELLLREGTERPPTLEAFLERFPGHADRLRRQWSLHRAIEDTRADGPVDGETQVAGAGGEAAPAPVTVPAEATWELEKRKPSCILRLLHQEPQEIRECGLLPR